jgi:Leucine Rich repeat
MDPICQECKQKAEFICFCNDKHLCKACREIHKKNAKGNHRILLCNDPDLENIRIQFRGPPKTPETKEKSLPAVEKVIEDPPELVREKTKMKEALSSELLLLSEFRDNLIETISLQAKSLVHTIVEKYSSCTGDFVQACDSTEKTLADALEHLNKSDDITSNSLLCKLLDYPNLTTFNLINVKSLIAEETIGLKNTLEFNIELVKFEETNQVVIYYNQNKDNLLPPIKPLFEQIITESHFDTSAIKIAKVPMGKDGVTQLCTILPEFTNLKILQLSENELGPEGMKMIGPAMQKISTIRKLSITKNALKGQGGKFLASALKEMKEIQALDLSGNKLGLEGLKPICVSLQSFTNLKSLKLMNNSLGNDCVNSIISFLSSLKKLKTLKLTGNKFGPEEQSLIEDRAIHKCSIRF